MQAQKGRAGIIKSPLKEIFQNTIEYYLQKTQNVHKQPTPGIRRNLQQICHYKIPIQRRAKVSVSHSQIGAHLGHIPTIEIALLNPKGLGSWSTNISLPINFPSLFLLSPHNWRTSSLSFGKVSLTVPMYDSRYFPRPPRIPLNYEATTWCNYW